TLRVPRVIVHRVPIDPCTGADLTIPAAPATSAADSPLTPIPETQPSTLEPTPAPQLQQGVPRTFAPQAESQPTPMPQPTPQPQPRPQPAPARPEPPTPQPRIEPGEATLEPNVNATFRSTHAPLVPVNHTT